MMQQDENPCLYCDVLLAEKGKLVCPYCDKRKEYEIMVDGEGYQSETYENLD